MTARSLSKLVWMLTAMWLAASAAAAAAETLLERGAYLMNSIVACGNCHTHKFGPMQGVELAGTNPTQFSDKLDRSLQVSKSRHEEKLGQRGVPLVAEFGVSGQPGT